MPNSEQILSNSESEREPESILLKMVFEENLMLEPQSHTHMQWQLPRNGT